jgi:hypothetical protein
MKLSEDSISETRGGADLYSVEDLKISLNEGNIVLIPFLYTDLTAASLAGSGHL